MSDDIPTSKAFLLKEAVYLMSLTTVETVLYTLSFVLYCQCARFSYSRLRDPARDGRRRTVLTFLLASVVFICATIDVALTNQYARILFVDYSSLPGGPLGPSAQAHITMILQVDNIVILIGQFLALSVLLWRVWVVYSGTHIAIPIIILASLIYLGYVVSYTLMVIFIWSPLASTLPNITRTLDIVAKTSLSLSAATSITMALMIATRLILVRRKHIKLMGKSDIAAQYWGIAAMLIESYSLSAAWNLGNLIAYILKNPPAHDFFDSTVQQAEFLSYFLVLYRVFSGRAWDQHTQTKLTTMRWDHGALETTNDSSQSMGIANIQGTSRIEVTPPVFPSRTDV